MVPADIYYDNTSLEGLLEKSRAGLSGYCRNRAILHGVACAPCCLSRSSKLASAWLRKRLATASPAFSELDSDSEQLSPGGTGHQPTVPSGRTLSCLFLRLGQSHLAEGLPARAPSLDLDYRQACSAFCVPFSAFFAEARAGSFSRMRADLPERSRR